MRVMMKKKGLGAPVVEPVVSGGDPYWDNVVFLSHFDGVSGTNNFIEETSRTITPVGGIQHSSSQSKFGGSSVTANGGHLTTPGTDTDFHWSTSDFTVEAWIYPEQFTSYNNRPVLIGQASINTDGNYWTFGLSGAGELMLYYYNMQQQRAYSGLTVSLNQWAHIAMTHSNGVITFFANGNKSSTINVNGTPLNGNEMPLCIGRHGNVNFVGHIDDVRITKGIARYIENFEVPTEAFHNTAPTPRTMDTYGIYNSFAFTGTNGLSSSSYSASSIYSTARSAECAFDGWGYIGGGGYDQYQTGVGLPARLGEGVWGSNGSSPWWIQVDFGEGDPVAFTGFVLRPYHIAYDFPKTFTAQVSDDGSTWIDVGAFTSQPTSDAQVFNLPTTVYDRYFRIDITDKWPGTGNVYISDMEIF